MIDVVKASKILDGLAHCLPVTEVDGMMECCTCPYETVCNEKTGVVLPVDLIEDVREFIKQTIGKCIVQ